MTNGSLRQNKDSKDLSLKLKMLCMSSIEDFYSDTDFSNTKLVLFFI